MYYRYVLKELSHHRQRMMVNCLGVAVGIALFVSINAVSAAHREAVSPAVPQRCNRIGLRPSDAQR